MFARCSVESMYPKENDQVQESTLRIHCFRTATVAAVGGCRNSRIVIADSDSRSAMALSCHDWLLEERVVIADMHYCLLCKGIRKLVSPEYVELQCSLQRDTTQVFPGKSMACLSRKQKKNMISMYEFHSFQPVNTWSKAIFVEKVIVARMPL